MAAVGGLIGGIGRPRKMFQIATGMKSTPYFTLLNRTLFPSASRVAM
jgi:hypothetical protein